jgi:hypothetical protein
MKFLYIFIINYFSFYKIKDHIQKISLKLFLVQDGISINKK